MITNYVGIDVSAQTVSVAWERPAERAGAAQSFEQSPAGYEALTDWLQAQESAPPQTQVVLEATGSYWMRVALSLHEAGYRVSLVNPKQAHHFAKGIGQQAKTDTLDAQMLARLAASVPLPAWTPLEDGAESLYQQLVEYENLGEMQQMLRNQLHALQQRTTVDEQVVARKQAMLDLINTQRKDIHRTLHDTLRSSRWCVAYRRLCSIPGIGLLSAAWLLVVSRGFTTCDRPQQLASYLGLAPHPDQSGTTRHTHRPLGHCGHARARRVLYQAAVSALRCNPIIQAFYSRLKQAGKHSKVALCACARKLVHIAFALVTKGQMFDPDYHFAA